MIDEQVFDRRREALERRFVQERRYRSDENIEIVVVGAASREDLMRTHARYFLTLDQLAAEVSRRA